MKQKDYFVAQITSDNRVFECSFIYKSYRAAFEASINFARADEDIKAILIHSKDSFIVVKRKWLI